MRNLDAVEESIHELEDRISRLRRWIERDRDKGRLTLGCESLLHSFEDTLDLARRRRLDLIAGLQSPAPSSPDAPPH